MSRTSEATPLRRTRSSYGSLQPSTGGEPVYEEDDRAFVEDTKPTMYHSVFKDTPEEPAEDMSAKITLLEHGRTMEVEHKKFLSVEHPTREQLDRCLHFRVGPKGNEIFGTQIPGLTNPIHPKNLFVVLWTGFMLLLTCTFVAFMQPAFIAFNYTITTSHTTAVIDLFVGAFFAFDVLVNFRVGTYYLCNGRSKLILDGQKIAQEYYAGMFWLDTLAAVPFFLQLAYYALQALRGHPPHPSGVALDVIRGLRLVRVVRLWKLFSSRKTMLGMEVSAIHESGSPVLVFAANVVYWFAFLVNLMGCCFIGCATVEGFCNSWITQIAAPIDSVPHYELPGRVVCEATGDVMPVGRTIYIAAVYFATTTITTVGYGDFTAQSDSERGVVVCFMLLGAFFIATVTGSMVGVLTKHTDPAESDFKDKIINADLFVKDNALTPQVRQLVLTYVQSAYAPHVAEAGQRTDLLAELPIPVRASAAADMVGERQLRSALAGASAETFVWLVGRMQPVQLREGHYLCLEGEKAPGVYFTVNGALAVLPRAAAIAAQRKLLAGATSASVPVKPQPLAVLSGRGHTLGGELAASPAGAEGSSAEPVAGSRVWGTCVVATVESALFLLTWDVLGAALRLGHAGQEERSALAESLRAADELRSLLAADEKSGGVMETKKGSGEKAAAGEEAEVKVAKSQ